MHGEIELVKLSLTKSLLTTLSASEKNLALKAILKSLPLRSILIFSLMFREYRI